MTQRYRGIADSEEAMKEKHYISIALNCGETPDYFVRTDRKQNYQESKMVAYADATSVVIHDLPSFSQSALEIKMKYSGNLKVNTDMRRKFSVSNFVKKVVFFVCKYQMIGCAEEPKNVELHSFILIMKISHQY